MHPHCSYLASSALLSNGWADDVLIEVDETGYITHISGNQTSRHAIRLEGLLLPGMLNLHSHAFQRAMAGLAERATAEKDSFWTWREIMYRFLEKLTPDDLQAIAAQVYIEMLKAGFTTVGEFHYIHHQPNGKPYQERGLTSHHIISAALEVGIAITHLPVLYKYSGFGGQKPADNQKRFINDETHILEMIASLRKTYKNNPQVTIGLAHHSLRAVTPEMLQYATAGMHHIAPQSPIHIHIAEQTKEVEDCLHWCAQRPVEWLLSNVDVNQHWCLIHATHMTTLETQRLARSHAVVGLCPITEANLGDGLFNLPEYLREKGKWGIGTDSNIAVSGIEELRLLEYGQRLLHQERAIVKTPNEPSVGTSLYRMALQGGAQALGRPAGTIEMGKRADFIVLDTQSPSLLFRSNSHILDALVFATNTNPVRHVIAGGKHVVKNFRHVAEDEVFKAYVNTMKKLSH
ncbi:formimidoylglutamate deiminase [Legionella sp.]|uniref:formimidoylglutamate deiminase n=1 Tax=Legionella sp. TaxID=459 RepID=UPI00321FD1C2